jgi:hypothetical protein
MASVSLRERLDPARHLNDREPAPSATSAAPVTWAVQ